MEERSANRHLDNHESRANRHSDNYESRANRHSDNAVKSKTVFASEEYLNYKRVRFEPMLELVSTSGGTSSVCDAEHIESARATPVNNSESATSTPLHPTKKAHRTQSRIIKAITLSKEDKQFFAQHEINIQLLCKLCRFDSTEKLTYAKRLAKAPKDAIHKLIQHESHMSSFTHSVAHITNIKYPSSPCGRAPL